MVLYLFYGEKLNVFFYGSQKTGLKVIDSGIHMFTFWFVSLLLSVKEKISK